MSRAGASPEPAGPSGRSGPSGAPDRSGAAGRGGSGESAGCAPAESLWGAWLLNACSAEEAAEVEAHLRHCARCAADVRAAHRAVAALAEADSTGDGPWPAPPPALWDGVTGSAYRRRPPAPRGLPEFARPYAAQFATLDALLSELGADDWRAEAAPGWSAAQVVAHLAATDSLLAHRLGAPPVLPDGLVDPGDPDDPGGGPGGPATEPEGSVRTPSGRGDAVALRTAAYTAWAERQRPEDVHEAWRAQAEALRSALARVGEEQGQRRVALGRAPKVPVADQALGRAFETWVHTADIAGRSGFRLPPPAARHLAPIADLGVRLLPPAMRVCGTPLGTRVLRLELTGRGGGVWLVGEAGAASLPTETTGPAGSTGADPGGGTEEPDARLVLGTVEFCLLVGGRGDPARLAGTARTTGSGRLAEEALYAAPAFAGP
ncbi:maleylpyruvate isomerase family mycothiol-dependent enzyme [Streptomyces sp. NPDC054796]